MAGETLQRDGNLVPVLGLVDDTTGIVVPAKADSVTGRLKVAATVTVTPGAGGSNTQVQYNSSGTLTGSSRFTYNDATRTISFGNDGDSTFVLRTTNSASGASPQLLIVVGNSNSSIDGSALNLLAGQGKNGGALNLQGGIAMNAAGVGGDVVITGGDKNVGSDYGAVYIASRSQFKTLLSQTNYTTGRTVFFPDSNGTIVLSTTIPATITSTGVASMIAADSSWLYVCTAANTWRRVALSTF